MTQQELRFTSAANVDQLAITRVKALIAKGEAVIATTQPGSVSTKVPGFAVPARVNRELFSGWRAQSLNFLESVLGESHVYIENFKQECKGPQPGETRSGVAILRVVLEDLEGGHLRRLTEIVHANTFADFLEMADYLLTDGGYKDAAAVMAGSTLEVHLRNLCEKNGIETHRNTDDGQVPKKAEALNADLAREEVYTKLDQKSVTAWLDLRNKAAHGHYDEYNGDQVALLIQGVREFISRLPA